MTLTISALAIVALGLLIMFGQGNRLRIGFSAICGAVIGGILTTLGTAIFGGIAKIGSAILGVFH